MLWRLWVWQEYPVEKLYRDAKIGKIYEGTSFMQLATIYVSYPNLWGTYVPINLLTNEKRWLSYASILLNTRLLCS